MKQYKTKLQTFNFKIQIYERFLPLAHSPNTLRYRAFKDMRFSMNRVFHRIYKFVCYFILALFIFQCSSKTYNLSVPDQFCGDTLVYNNYFKEINSIDIKHTFLYSYEKYTQGSNDDLMQNLYNLTIYENLEDSFIKCTVLLVKFDTINNYYLDQISFTKDEKQSIKLKDTIQYVINPVTGEVNEIISHSVIRRYLVKEQISTIEHLLSIFKSWNSFKFDQNAKFNYVFKDVLDGKFYYTTSNSLNDFQSYKLLQNILNLSICNN